MGITPHELYDMSLYEYNYYAEGVSIARKNESVNCILTGYYAAYYVNGGNKARKPKELIELIFGKENSYRDSAEDINKTKALFGDD